MQTNARLQEQLILEHIKKLERAEKSFLPLSDMFGQSLSPVIITEKLQKNLKT